MTEMKIYIVCLLITLKKEHTARLRHQSQCAANRTGDFTALCCVSLSKAKRTQICMSKLDEGAEEAMRT